MVLVKIISFIVQVSLVKKTQRSDLCCVRLQAYYGGEARCEEAAGVGDVYDPKELVCGGCSDVSRAQVTAFLTLHHYHPHPHGLLVVFMVVISSRSHYSVLFGP
jgi:hypothetical protein